MKLLVWGANPAHAFPGDDCIPTPTEVGLPDEGGELIWLGWAEAIGRKRDGTLFHLSSPNSPISQPPTKVSKIISGDNAVAYLDTSGYVHVLPRFEHAFDAISQASTSRDTSLAQWADVAASETVIMGLTPAGLLIRFVSLDALLHFDVDDPTPFSPPALSGETEYIALPPLPAATFRLYALETRLFVHVAGAGMQQLLELVRGEDDLDQGTGSSNGGKTANGTDNRVVIGEKGSGRGVQARTRLVQIDVDALSFTVVPGPKNRLGVLCDTGEAYLLDSRTRGLEWLTVPTSAVLAGSRRSSDANGVTAGTILGAREPNDDSESDNGYGDGVGVRLLGIGAGFEVVVRDDGVFTRGENKFGQLGNGQVSDATSDTFLRLPIDAERVTGVFCSRWTTVLTLS